MSGYSLEKLFFGAQKEFIEVYVLSSVNRTASVNSKNSFQDHSSNLTARYDGMMERLSSHIFVLDPTVRPDGAKHIGYIGNKLMVEPSENAFDALVNKRSMRLGSFGVGPTQRPTSID